MQGEPATKGSTPTGAVFLSYASQDAPVVKRICEALRSAGVEVWFDQSELRGGEAWDRSIRQQIRECQLFVPVISAHTDTRREGYFRLEWKLAVDRTHTMSERAPFLVPVVIDDTSDSRADVPDRFREVQWTRLPGGETPSAFVKHMQRLLSAEPSSAGRSGGPLAAPATRQRAPASGWSGRMLTLAATLVLGAAAYLAIERPWISKTPASVVFAPPPHSIAVLPFVNMSGDKDQEYFSEGLTEELLNSLAQINQLQVAARTSAFSFKGTNTDIPTIARKLNVGAVLEGSVRRSDNTVRITAQLINAVTGYHLWSHSYDRDLTDVLQLQTQIADAVASALKVSLLGDVATKIELGGTRNPAAFDAYLRGRKAYMVSAHSGAGKQTMIAAYTEAIELDPNYALAFANRSLAFNGYAWEESGAAARERFEKAHADATQAIALAPDLAEGQLALAAYLETVDFTRANAAYERALALAPGNARVLRDYGIFAVHMGRTEAGIAAARRSVVLDPLNAATYGYLGAALYFGRRNREAIEAFGSSLAIDPENIPPYWLRGLAYYALGDFQSARASCASKRDDWESQQCLAVTYDKLGRRTDAESMLARMKAQRGDGAAYSYAAIYAQWGSLAQALDWLETAMRLRDRGLEDLRTDPLMDPLRTQPRFQAVMRELNFPD